MEYKDKIMAELKAENERLEALCDTYKTCYQAKHNDIDGKLFKYRQTLQEVKRILCEGRTFYDGYFDNPESLSRIDKAIYLITKAESEG